MALVIRPWRPTDELPVQMQILEMLGEVARDGHVLAPTQANAVRLWNQGLAWSAAGEPTLAAEEGGQVVAWTLWGPVPEEFDLNYRPCYGLGTYVVPAQRRAGVASTLRARSITCAKERGYEYVVGTAHSEKGLRSSIAVGFVLAGQEVRLWLRS